MSTRFKIAAPVESKEQKKKREKEEKEKASQKLAERNPPYVDKPGDALFGDLKTIQSQYKLQRKFIALTDLNKSLAGQKVWIRGRAETVRQKGKLCFIVIRRGFSTVQAGIFESPTVPRDMVNYSGKIPTESIIEIFATAQPTAKPTSTTQSDVELLVEKIYVVSAAEALPFQLDAAQASVVPDKKDDQTITVKQETRLNNRWIDLRTPANHAIFRIQSAVGTYFREYFLKNNFVEIHTPKITPGVSEGGAAVFRLDYFGQPACLAQSPQLYKQMASACSDLFRVFEIGPVFRAENSNTHRHLCEFMGLDFEMEIWEHYFELLDVLHGAFTYIFDSINKSFKEELAAVCKQYPFEPLQYTKDPLIIHFPEAIKMLREAGEKMDDFEDFSTPQEKKLGKLVKAKYKVDFYIVDRYPLKVRPFYTMPCADDPRYSNSYDVFLRGEEITSGAQRVHELELLKRRAIECGIPLSNISAYLESFKYGTPPHGGAGIGLERVVMLFMGLDDIRKSCMFPRDPLRLSP